MSENSSPPSQYGNQSPHALPDPIRFLSEISEKKTFLESAADSILSDLLPADVSDFDTWFRQSLSSPEHSRRVAYILQLPTVPHDQLLSLFYDPTVFGGSMKGLLQRRMFYHCASFLKLIGNDYAPVEWQQLYKKRIVTLLKECKIAIDKLDEKSLNLPKAWGTVKERLLNEATPIHKSGIYQDQNYPASNLAGFFRTPSLKHQKLLYILMSMSGIDKKTDIKALAEVATDLMDDSADESYRAMLFWFMERILCCARQSNCDANALSKFLKHLEKFKMPAIWETISPQDTKRRTLGDEKFPEMPEIYIPKRYAQFYLLNCMKIIVHLRHLALSHARRDSSKEKIIQLVKDFAVPYIQWNGQWHMNNDVAPTFFDFTSNMGQYPHHPWWISEEIQWLHSYFHYTRKMLLFDFLKSCERKANNTNNALNEKKCTSVICEKNSSVGETKCFWNPYYKTLRKSIGERDAIKQRLGKKAVGIVIVGPPGTGKTTIFELIPALYELKVSEYEKIGERISMQYVTSVQDLATLLHRTNHEKIKVFLFDEFHSDVPFNQYSFFLSPLEEGNLSVPGNDTVDCKNCLFLFATSAYQTKAEFLSKAIQTNNYPMRDFATRITTWIEIPSMLCLPHDSLILLDAKTSRVKNIRNLSLDRRQEEIEKIGSAPMRSAREIISFR